MPTSFSVGYDDLQPIAGRVRLDVVPFLVREPPWHVTIGGLDGLQHRLIERPDIGVALDDVLPTLVGQLDRPPAGIIDCCADRHDDSIPGATSVSSCSVLSARAPPQPPSNTIQVRNRPLSSPRPRTHPCGSASQANSCSQDAPGWIRTSDLRIRSPLLYPAELRGRAP